VAPTAAPLATLTQGVTDQALALPARLLP
jgi:hypothetical protein